MAMSPGYAGWPVTKVPNWHGLVAWDLLFNNLATGLFLVAAVGDLAGPADLAAVARLAYPLALALLSIDLALLVADLGDPLRFHHLLRVFTPYSPMSLGTWSLTAYSLPLTLLAADSVLGLLPAWAHTAAVVAAIVPAAGSVLYKGVLFSTTSQPAWKDARWLGGYLTSSAFLLGCAVLLALAMVTGQGPAAALLRRTLVPLLLVNGVAACLLLADLRAAVDGRLVAALAAGTALPLCLLLLPADIGSVAALVLIMMSSLIIRFRIVGLPRSPAGARPSRVE
jgi:hypothetical protein